MDQCWTPCFSRPSPVLTFIRGRTFLISKKHGRLHDSFVSIVLPLPLHISPNAVPSLPAPPPFLTRSPSSTITMQSRSQPQSQPLFPVPSFAAVGHCGEGDRNAGTRQEDRELLVPLHSPPQHVLRRPYQIERKSGTRI